MSSLHVGGDASVIPWWALVVPEHVDETLRHDSALSKQVAARADAKSHDLEKLLRQNQSTVVVRRATRSLLGEVHLRAPRYGGQPSRGLPTVAHANVGKRERRLVPVRGYAKECSPENVE